MYQPQEEQRSTFRLDVPLHQLLTSPVSERVEFQPIGVPQRFPEPIFPQHPELLGAIEEDPADNVAYISKGDWPAVEETIQWLTEKQDSGYKMVNSNSRLWQMVAFMKGDHFPWNCRAGQNSMIIRVDGTLAPCFPTQVYSALTNIDEAITRLWSIHCQSSRTTE